MKIALIGYGKMGKMIEQIALSRGHEIVCVIDIDNQQDFESEAFKSADVAIEFTAPQAAYGNYLKAWKQGVKVVSGSTGWMKEHGDDVRNACTPSTLHPSPSTKYISAGIYGLHENALLTLDGCMKRHESRMRHFQRALLADSLCLEAYPFSKVFDIDHASDIAKAEQFL